MLISFLSTAQNGSVAYPVSYLMGARDLSLVVKLTTYLYLVPSNENVDLYIRFAMSS
jgi:hypothetical protein